MEHPHIAGKVHPKGGDILRILKTVLIILLSIPLLIIAGMMEVDK
jgi:hypothetical protein